MDKKKLMKLTDSYRKKADAAYQNYQETGISRYCNIYHHNNDLAEALQMAAHAADEHSALIAIRGSWLISLSGQLWLQANIAQNQRKQNWRRL